MSATTEDDPQNPVWPDETQLLLFQLERQRATFAWKTGGLDAAGLAASLPPSTMTLGGLVKHLALVEVSSFVLRLHGRDPGPPWNTVDFDADPDWEWRSAADDRPQELYALWHSAVRDARAGVREALAGGGLDRRTAVAMPDGRSPSLRRLLGDLVEEYARHVGHADLLRESVDGLTGEDPETLLPDALLRVD